MRFAQRAEDQAFGHQVICNVPENVGCRECIRAPH